MCLWTSWEITLRVVIKVQRMYEANLPNVTAAIEAAPTSTPQRMDDKWSGNSLLLGSSSLANHGWLPQLLFSSPTYLLITTLKTGC
jgi:hypothetical protein